MLGAKDREIGFGGLTEIVRWRDKGLRLVGRFRRSPELPPPTRSRCPPNRPTLRARALLRVLGSPDARAILTEYGFDR